MIVDRGEANTWRYEVWFGYPESRGKATKTKGGRMRAPEVVQYENIERLRQAYKGRTVESWNALSKAEKNRWIKKFGGEDAALEAYRNGLKFSEGKG
jgi:hypothetical protein